MNPTPAPSRAIYSHKTLTEWRAANPSDAIMACVSPVRYVKFTKSWGPTSPQSRLLRMKLLRLTLLLKRLMPDSAPRAEE
jgi:hypothetical protein